MNENVLITTGLNGFLRKSGLLLFTFLSFLGFGQVSTLKLSTKTVIEKCTYELDGGIFVLGQSRVIIPIDLPENTLEWYYAFTSFSNEDKVESNSATINLAAQITRVIDKTGITSAALSMILTPSGSAACNVYLFPDYGHAKNFYNKTEQDFFPTNWEYFVNSSMESARQGKKRIANSGSRRVYLGIKAGTSPVIVKIEGVAVVQENNVDMLQWSTEMRDNLYTGTKEAFRENGLTETAAAELARCSVDGLVALYTPAAYQQLSPAEQEEAYEAIARGCAEKMDGGVKTEMQVKAETYGNLGWNHYEAGNLAKAIEFSKKALELNKNMGWVETNMGLFYLIQGDELTATDYYVEAIIDLKQDKLSGKDYFEAAIQDIKDALKKYPGMEGHEAILKVLEVEVGRM